MHFFLSQSFILKNIGLKHQSFPFFSGVKPINQLDVSSPVFIYKEVNSHVATNLKSGLRSLFLKYMILGPVQLHSMFGKGLMLQVSQYFTWVDLINRLYKACYVWVDVYILYFSFKLIVTIPKLQVNS